MTTYLHFRGLDIPLGLGLRGVIFIYHALGYTTDKLIVLMLYIANTSKQEIAHSFFFIQMEKYGIRIADQS